MSAIPVEDLSPAKGKLYVELAASPEDIRASQALRYQVFAEELGARLDGEEPGLDSDRFDAHCQHMLVRERDSGRIVASTRLLTDALARQAGGFYSQSEFEMDAVLALPGRRLEIGRTCVDPHFRQGAAIAVLWSGLAAFVNLHSIDYLFGCASIELRDGGVRAHAIMDRVRQHAMTAPPLRVSPLLTLPTAEAYDPKTVSAPFPPLLKAYFRLGARAAGEPCFDPDFNVADVFVLVDVCRIDATYSRHFLERSLRD